MYICRLLDVNPARVYHEFHQEINAVIIYLFIYLWGRGGKWRKKIICLIISFFTKLLILAPTLYSPFPHTRTHAYTHTDTHTSTHTHTHARGRGRTHTHTHTHTDTHMSLGNVKWKKKSQKIWKNILLVGLIRPFSRACASENTPI